MCTRASRNFRTRCFLEAFELLGSPPALSRGLGINYVSEAEFVPDPVLRMIPTADAEIYTYAHVVVLQKRVSSRTIRALRHPRAVE